MTNGSDSLVCVCVFVVIIYMFLVSSMDLVILTEPQDSDGLIEDLQARKSN